MEEDSEDGPPASLNYDSLFAAQAHEAESCMRGCIQRGPIFDGTLARSRRKAANHIGLMLLH